MSNLASYRKKTDAELRFIVRDAFDAATATRDHDPIAEAKYLDQINDASTVLAERERARPRRRPGKRCQVCMLTESEHDGSEYHRFIPEGPCA